MTSSIGSVLIALVVLLLLAPVGQDLNDKATAPAQTITPSKDLLGWQETRWGMTTKEVLQVVTPVPVKLEKRSYLSRGGDGGKPFDRYGYADYHTTIQVLGEDYKAYFYMDVKTDRLMQVTLEPARYGFKDYIPEAAFTQLYEALTQKYGKPIGHEDDRSKGAYTRTEQVSRLRQWVFPTTSIRLYYMGLEDVRMYSLTITYSPSKNKDTDTL